MLWCAAFPELGARIRFLDPLQHEAADALGALLRFDVRDIEAGFGVEAAKRIAQLQPALRNVTDPAPFAMASACGLPSRRTERAY